MLDETVEHRLDVALVERRIAQLESPFDHRARAVADEMGEIGIAHRRELAGGNRIIEAVDKVGGGIDQGSVEIENDKQRRHAVLLYPIVKSFSGSISHCGAV
jgi:hypothetical protein